MRAIVLKRHGGADALRITEVAMPEPRAGEVRVRVQRIGINFAEVLSRRGVYGWAPPLPYILGMEAFGTIDAVGAGVSSHSFGDAVIVGTQCGTYAEFLCIPADRALAAPRGFTPDECAAFAVNYLTAWIGLMEMARLRPADTLLVTSAAGGVGTAAVQIGRAFGARIIGAASSAKLDAVRALGAHLAVDYRDLDAIEEVNVVLEMAGGDVYRAARKRLAPMGRLVMAGASAAFPRTKNPFARLASLRNLPLANIFDMIRRSYGVMCFHLGWLLDQGVIRPQWDALLRFTGEHPIRPLVGHTFAFDELPDAHRLLEERRNIGKVVVRVA